MKNSKKTLAVLIVLVLAAAAIIFAVIIRKKPDSTPISKEETESSKETKESEETESQKETGKTETDNGTEKPAGLVPEDMGYTLVWKDEFDGDSLNMDDWSYEYHEPGWVNNELQEYVDSAENIYVKDGKLIIQALKKNEGGKTVYTSGRINTQNKRDYKYGMFEVRAKVPAGKGFLPAAWLMPTNENLYGQWPKCGEIDIMEVLGNKLDTSYSTLHFGEPHTQSQGSFTLPDGDFASDFHVFTCEWEPGKIVFYVDGNIIHEESDWFTKKTGFGEITYPAPFDQPFYLILNLAVGGDWPGNPDDSTEFGDNAQLVVDYVKVYQKDSYDENVEKPSKEVSYREPDETGNYIVNGSFENEALDDNEFWSFLLFNGGEGSANIADNTLNIDTIKEGDVDYSVQIIQPGLPMYKGSTYKLTFDAWADETRNIIVDISAPDKGWIRYLADTEIEVPTEKKSYEFTFEVSTEDDPNGRMEFNLGHRGSTASVHISNVRVERVGGQQTADEKSVLPDGNCVYNGEFQQGSDRLESWVVENGVENAEVYVTNTDNVRELLCRASADVIDIADIKLIQKGLPLAANKEYVLSFDAHADNDKNIAFVIDGVRIDFEITADKNTYKHIFKTGSELLSKDLEILLGNTGETYIDNVRIQENALLLNGDFQNGMTGFEVYAYTKTDVSYVVDSLNEDNAFSIDISNTGDLDWKIQLMQRGILLEKGKTYKLSFDAKSSINRDIMYALQRDGASDDNWIPYSGSQIISLTDEFGHFQTEFVMENDTDPSVILSISMGAVGGKQISDKHTVVIDNIVLEEIK